MDADTTKVMQEALQAAVTRLNSNGAEPRAAPPGAGPPAAETIGALMSFVPRLLQNNETGPQMLEKLDAMRKGELTTLKGHVQLLRKQCYRAFKQQERLLQKLEDLQKQQTAVAHAVLELAQQMARITFVDDVDAEHEDADEDDDRDDDEWERPPERHNHRRVETRANRKQNGNRAAANADRARP